MQKAEVAKDSSLNKIGLRIRLDLLSLTGLRVTVKLSTILIVLFQPALNKESFLPTRDCIVGNRKLPLKCISARNVEVDEAFLRCFILPILQLLLARELRFKQALIVSNFLLFWTKLAPPSSTTSHDRVSILQ